MSAVETWPPTRLADDPILWAVRAARCWLYRRRYVRHMMKRSGCSRRMALDEYYGCGGYEYHSETGFGLSPEASAEESMSYWDGP